jgi:two-component system LytT family response regulator
MQKPLTAIIIDDERLARKDLASLLSEHPAINVVGEADNVSAAIIAIEQLNPDVIFLDIQMPGESGFDLLNKINIKAKVIFVTAFDEYAIRAFEVNALDYLLKPVNPDRLARAIERLEQIDEAEPIELRKLKYDDRLFLMIDNKMKFLKLKTIVCVSAAGDYSEILMADKQKGLALKSMKEWEVRLPEEYFCRIHRSTIINMEYIDRLEEWFNYSYRVYLKGIEKPLIMSRRYVMKLKKRLG